jgi:hypothetical protein
MLTSRTNVIGATLLYGVVYWDSPWGEGRPGWHIECSAMTNAYFGQRIISVEKTYPVVYLICCYGI